MNYKRVLLKSDHCGIEIVTRSCKEERFFALKSDHCGIEIAIALIIMAIMVH